MFASQSHKLRLAYQQTNNAIAGSCQTGLRIDFGVQGLTVYPFPPTTPIVTHMLKLDMYLQCINLPPTSNLPMFTPRAYLKVLEPRMVNEVLSRSDPTKWSRDLSNAACRLSPARPLRDPSRFVTRLRSLGTCSVRKTVAVDLHEFSRANSHVDLPAGHGCQSPEKRVKLNQPYDQSDA